MVFLVYLMRNLLLHVSFVSFGFLLKSNRQLWWLEHCCKRSLVYTILLKTLWYISVDEFGMLNYTCYLHLLILVSNSLEQGEIFLCIFTLLLLHLILHVSFKLPYKFLFSIFLKCFLRAVTDIFQVIMNEDIFPILHSKRIFYEVVLD